MSVRSIHWLFAGILVFISASGSRAAVTIRGKAPLLAGSPIQLAMISDYITQIEKPIADYVIGNDGQFQFQIDIQQSGQYILKIGNNFHLVYLEPNHEYSLEIPDSEGQDLFYPDNKDTTQLFYVVGSITYDFNSFNINNYEKIVAGTVKSDAMKFVGQVQAKYGWLKDPFAIAVREYKLAQFQLVLRLKSPKTIYETYLANQPVLYRHPDYMEFFNMFYEGLMVQMVNSNRQPQIRNIITNGTSYDSLKFYVMKHEWIQREDIAELFVARGLYDVYYKMHFEKNRIESLLTEQEARTTSVEIKTIIGNFRNLIAKLKPGSPSIPFEGRTPDGTVINLADRVDKPVYLCFFNTTDPSSIAEIPAINNLYDRYKKDVYFIGVCSSCSYNSLYDFIQKYKLKFEVIVADPSVDAEYEILRYPTAFLIGTGGTFRESPALLPSEGADRIIFPLTRKGRQNDNR